MRSSLLVRRTAGITLMACGLLVAPPAAQARDWQVDPEASTIDFIFRQMGSPVRGRFEEFTAEISFDPDALDAARVAAEIVIDSVNTGNPERDEGIVGADWFDTATYPTARFESTGFSHAGGDDYVVAGELTVRDVTQAIEMPMTISLDGDSATATGTLELDRRDFEVGRGEWASDAAVGYDVILELTIAATAG